MVERMNLYLFLLNDKYERLSYIPLPKTQYSFIGREHIKQLCEDAYGSNEESYFNYIVEVEMQDETHSLKEHFIIEQKQLLDESFHYYIYDRNQQSLTYINNREISAQGKRIQSGDIISIPISVQNSIIVQNVLFSVFSEKILVLDASELDRLEDISQKTKDLSPIEPILESPFPSPIKPPKIMNAKKNAPIKKSTLSSPQQKKSTKSGRKLNAIKSSAEFKSLKYAKYKSVVLDGSNIARSTTQSKKAKLTDVMKTYNALIQSGVPEDKIFVIFSASLRHNLIDVSAEEYGEVLRRNNFQQAPKSTDDDWFIIDFALRTEGLILTNDFFANYREKYPHKAQEIDNASLRYTLLADQVMFDEQADLKLHWLIHSNKNSL